MAVVTNISAYRFASLTELKPLRDQLIASCRDWALKGTILLSSEGINLFVAGPADAIDQLLAQLRMIPGLESLEPKVSESRDQPFTRMLVKIKKEIITFGVDSVDPIHNPAPRITARELKTWLDEGRPITLLDTRNDFEVAMGTFRNAKAIGIPHFREFPAAIAKLSANDSSHPIVTFCTGGIRCEKAAPLMIQHGFQNVFQLDGGILKYFEECGREHYDGECFVFDKRVGLSADLNESGHGICFVCQNLLTPEELSDPLTVEGVSCPRCYRSPDRKRAEEFAEHRLLLQKIKCPLPGSQPIDNFRPLKIHARHDRWTLLDFLSDIFQYISRSEWNTRIERRELVDASKQPISATQIVRPGEQYFTREPLQIEPDVNADIDILHEDDAIIVVNKPAPLPIHPSGRFHRNTLQWILAQVYSPQKPRPAHRLDANTSGVVVFTRTAHFAKLLQPQFERGDVQKQYLALVIGHPPTDFFTCDAAISSTPGQSGSRTIHEGFGLSARTDFEVLSRRNDGTSLLKVTPLTGRTNQIRVHLWHLGIPIAGDSTYLLHHQLGDIQTHALLDQPLCLHAWRLTIQHPQHGQPATFEATIPEWGCIENAE